MTKNIIFRVRLDQADLDQLDHIAGASQRTKSQVVRAAIAIMAQLFSSNKPPVDLSSQDQRPVVPNESH